MKVRVKGSEEREEKRRGHRKKREKRTDLPAFSPFCVSALHSQYARAPELRANSMPASGVVIVIPLSASLRIVSSSLLYNN